MSHRRLQVRRTSDSEEEDQETDEEPSDLQLTLFVCVLWSCITVKMKWPYHSCSLRFDIRHRLASSFGCRRFGANLHLVPAVLSLPSPRRAMPRRKQDCPKRMKCKYYMCTTVRSFEASFDFSRRVLLFLLADVSDSWVTAVRSWKRRMGQVTTLTLEGGPPCFLPTLCRRLLFSVSVLHNIMSEDSENLTQNRGWYAGLRHEQNYERNFLANCFSWIILSDVKSLSTESSFLCKCCAPRDSWLVSVSALYTQLTFKVTVGNYWRPGNQTKSNSLWW
jgi:hypothetical protein